MTKIEILRDTVVKMAKGTVVEVSDEEAKRLAAFGNAKAVAEKPVKPAGKKKA